MEYADDHDRVGGHALHLADDDVRIRRDADRTSAARKYRAPEIGEACQSFASGVDAPADFVRAPRVAWPDIEVNCLQLVGGTVGELKL
jgi:hypothetical protein